MRARCRHAAACRPRRAPRRSPRRPTACGRSPRGGPWRRAPARRCWPRCASWSCGSASAGRRSPRPAANGSPPAPGRPCASRFSRSPTAAAVAPPMPESTSSNTMVGGIADLGQADLERQQEARQLAARGDLGDRRRRRAGIGGDGELHAVGAGLGPVGLGRAAPARSRTSPSRASAGRARPPPPCRAGPRPCAAPPPAPRPRRHRPRAPPWPRRPASSGRPRRRRAPRAAPPSSRPAAPARPP